MARSRVDYIQGVGLLFDENTCSKGLSDILQAVNQSHHLTPAV